MRHLQNLMADALTLGGDFAETLIQELKKLIFKDVFQLHDKAEMVERRLLVVENLLHHRLLTAQEDAVYLVLELQNTSQFFIQAFLYLLDFLKLIDNEDDALLLGTQLVNQLQHILQNHVVVFLAERIERHFNAVVHRVGADGGYNPEIA